jgi:very-short-patch-repair endonuclease
MIAEIDTPACTLTPKMHAEVSISAIMGLSTAVPGGGRCLSGVCCRLPGVNLPGESVWWHGAVTRPQLLAGGTPAGTINAWLGRGKLVRVLPGVYARPPVAWLTRVGAALLWCPQAAASHRTAAWLWQLADSEEPPIVEVTVPCRCSRRSPQPWLRMYRRDLPASRLERCGHLPTVEPEQTVLDCLAVLPPPAGQRLVDTALGRLVRKNLLYDRYLTNLGRRGSRSAAQVLPLAVPGAASHPEQVLANALHTAGITGFRVNQPVRGYVADLLDAKRRLIIEVDGWATHRTRTAFQGDRTRQNVLVAAGYTVLRYTASDIQHRIKAVITQIQQVITDLDHRV